MIIVIGDHAHHKYARKVLGKNLDELNREEREEINKNILDAVTSPEAVYHGRKDMPQVHIRGDIAVPVGVDINGSKELGPYNDLTDDLKVPTVYKDEVFRSKLEDANNKART